MVFVEVSHQASVAMLLLPTAKKWLAIKDTEKAQPGVFVSACCTKLVLPCCCSQQQRTGWLPRDIEQRNLACLCQHMHKASLAVLQSPQP